jgi:hypothetical protein
MNRLLLLAFAVPVIALRPTSAWAETGPCPEATNLTDIHVFCHYSGPQFRALVSTPTDGVTYSLLPMCVEMPDPGDSCVNQQRCEEPPGTWKYMVFRSSPGNPNVPWGTVCLGADVDIPVITPGRVLAEMRRLTWPDAELTIEPPDGRTLVNFETNFFTTTTEPTTQTVTLLGQRVDIEATPVRYAWHFGDGADRSGAEPGAAYPDLGITHVYREAGVTVHPSVDVTYHGRYRVNGGGWQDIPEELTVTGSPVALQVLTATPHLVG